MRRYPPPLLGWLRFFFYHFAISRFFGFRGTFLSLGSGVDCIDCVWLVIRLQFSIGWKKIGELFFC